MNLTDLTLPPHLQRYALIGLPAFGLLAALAIATPRYMDFKNQQENLVKVRASVLDKQTTLEQLKSLPLGPTVARVPATREEPVLFLHNLNALAARCHVRLITYSAPTVTATPDPTKLTGTSTPANGGAADGLPGLPPGTTPAVLSITAEGTYAATALFFNQLETYPRLLSVSQVTMTADANSYPVLTTQFQLTRYLGSEEAAPQGGASPTPSPTPPPAKP